MTIGTFRHYLRKSGALRLSNDLVIGKQGGKIELYNINENTSKVYDSFEAFLSDEIFEEKTGSDYVKEFSLGNMMQTLTGGRGSSSEGNSTFSFGHAGFPGKDNSKKDFPSRFNGAGDTSLKTTLKKFREKHALDSSESGVIVDDNGYVLEYNHGQTSSVRMNMSLGGTVYHNHPSGSNFSDLDLINTSTSPLKGVVASGKAGDYSFTKTNHFKAMEFVKAVKTAKISGKDYNDATDKWLKRNQKKYGYKYSFTKA